MFRKKEHDHRWYMQPQTKKEFEPVDTQPIDAVTQLYELVEYAYLVCTGCPDGPTVIKTIVREGSPDGKEVISSK